MSAHFGASLSFLNLFILLLSGQSCGANLLLFDPDGDEREVSLSDEDFRRADDYDSAVQSDASARTAGGAGADSAYVGASPSRFEGDIVGLNFGPGGELRWSGRDRPDDGTMRNAAVRRSYLWPNGIVPYAVDSRYTGRSRRIIASAIKEILSKTCVQLVPRDSAVHSDYIYITSDDGEGCYSSFGRDGGRQVLSLESDGCVTKGIAQHELMHAVGFLHEQARTDRDEYVDIVWDNIESGKDRQFRSYDTDYIRSLGTDYDYGSVMHYGSHYFSANGRPTIKAKRRNARIGQRVAMSDNDVLKLNLLYGCAVAGNDTTWTAAEKACVRMNNLACDTAQSLEECKSKCNGHSDCCSVDWTDLSGSRTPAACCLNTVNKVRAIDGGAWSQPCYDQSEHSYYTEPVGKCGLSWSEPTMACIKGSNIDCATTQSSLAACQAHCHADPNCCSVDWTNTGASASPGACCMNTIDSVGAHTAGSFSAPCYEQGKHTVFAELVGKCGAKWSRPRRACVRGSNLECVGGVTTIEECKALCNKQTDCCSVDWTSPQSAGSSGTCCLNGINAGGALAAGSLNVPCYDQGEHTLFTEPLGKCGVSWSESRKACVKGNNLRGCESGVATMEECKAKCAATAGCCSADYTSTSSPDYAGECCMNGVSKQRAVANEDYYAPCYVSADHSWFAEAIGRCF